jgi:hypothetical protein
MWARVKDMCAIVEVPMGAIYEPGPTSTHIRVVELHFASSRSSSAPEVVFIREIGGSWGRRTGMIPILWLLDAFYDEHAR